MLGLMMAIARQDDGLSHPSDGSDHREPATAPAQKIGDHYAQIGQALMTCEAAFCSVGIPWLPPSRRVSALRQQCDQPLKEFLRCSLVTVSTSSLESYLDDLQSLPATEDSAHELSIAIDSPIERHAFSALTGVVTAAVALASLQTINLSLTGTVIAATALTAIGVAIAEFLSNDWARRVTFHRELLAELKRRKGSDRPSMTRLPLSPVGTK